MKLKELQERLKPHDLGMVWDVDGKMLSVGHSTFANPLLWFDAFGEYTGSVQVKAINVPLFSESQVRVSLLLVDRFLHTPVESRGLASRNQAI